MCCSNTLFTQSLGYLSKQHDAAFPENVNTCSCKLHLKHFPCTYFIQFMSHSETLLFIYIFFSDQLDEANNALKDANRRLNKIKAANAALIAERDHQATALRDTEDALKNAENILSNLTAAVKALRAEIEQTHRGK